jgi:hypothetical protein
MADGSFRIHHITHAPYTNGSNTIRVEAKATPAELTKAIMKTVRRSEAEHRRYLANLAKQEAARKSLRGEILSYRSPGYMAGVADGMEEDV